ncbi:MAG: putative membrane protein, partial [Pseudohongiellaceae bacterium]
MQQLSDEFLDSCRREDGRILRGENMTRIETFVDAAFAFVFTMLVISIDEIPKTVPELLDLSQDIPAFLISATIIGLIWVAHTVWSRTFGLQDRATLYLSLGLVMLVLIFVYPIKLVVQLSIGYFSQGALQQNLEIMELSDIINLFIYFALGLMALCSILIALYQNSLRQRRQLVLSEYEIAFCKIACLTWAIVGATALVSCLAAPVLG